MKREEEDDQLDVEPSGGGHGVGIAGAIALAAVVGLGVGLLAAPQSGERTREQLRKRISAIGEDIEDGLEEFEERSRPARRELRKRTELLRKRGEKALEDLEDRLDRVENRDEDHGGGLLSLVTFAAGIAASYFLTSERAAPTRAKMREAATDLRQRASDRWDRFQERRHSNGGGSQRTPQPESPGGLTDN
ncbi:MAG TPA: YtxH domain-containing protein [Gemmatimonadales bacterium]|jgi:gas vesicle protein